MTVNNPTQVWSQIQWPSTVNYCIGQLESGESGTPHWQLLIKFKHPVRLNQLKKIFPRCHAEVRKGSEIQAIEYVTKEDSRIESLIPYGISLEQVEALLTSTSNSRAPSGLSKIKDLMDAGATETEIADEFFGDWVRHYRAFRAYKLLKQSPRTLTEAPTVVVIWGPTGTGKSRYCLEQFPCAYWKQRSNWWDGYASQDVVILDEFYGWLPFDFILRLCDRYPLMLETKGGQVHCLASTIVFTTNTLPDNWYRNCYFKSLERRVTSWMIFHNMFCSRYSTFSEFKQNSDK